MKILVLVGSGEFTPKMIPVDHFLLSQIKGPKSVAILPTAAGAERNPHKWIDDGIKHFKKLNARPFGVKVLKKKDTSQKRFLNQVKKASLIYFSGGNPRYLYETIKTTPLWNLVFSLYKNSTILAGSSAGAMVMGNYVLSNAKSAFLAAQDSIWTRGLSLVDYAILPHFDFAKKEKPVEIKKIIDNALNRKLKLLCIDEDTALVVFNNKNAKVLGEGNVYLLKKNKEIIYQTGESFDLNVVE